MKNTLKGFKQFILRGNVVDLAVGIVVGAGFSGIINSFVKDFITPLLGIFIKSADFANWSFTVGGSKFMPGDFINAIISFIIIALIIYFFVVLPMNALISRMNYEPPANPTTKKCPECCSEISISAKRCAFCTQVIA